MQPEEEAMNEKFSEQGEPLLPPPVLASEKTTLTSPYKNYFFVFINGAATIAVVFLNKM